MDDGGTDESTACERAARDRAIHGPLLLALEGHEVIYYERFATLVRLIRVEVDDARFSARAEPVLSLQARPDGQNAPDQAWNFGANWEYISCGDHRYGAAYGSWVLYTDPELVGYVKELKLALGEKDLDFKRAWVKFLQAKRQY